MARKIRKMWLLKELRKRFSIHFFNGKWHVYDYKRKKMNTYTSTGMAILNMTGTFLSISQTLRFMNKIYKNEYCKQYPNEIICSKCGQ